MSETVAHVTDLTDEELYEELKKCGFPVGPIVG
jgi:hypothetical protein